MTQAGTITSMQRVLTTLSHKEPDRVPLFLLVTMHGAKELGLSIKEYFSRADYVVEGQLRMLKKYRHDCLYPFFYTPIEVEAFGGEVIFYDDGPPNAGTPIIKKNSGINTLTPPVVNDTKCLVKVLETIKSLKEKAEDKTPIIGVAVSPFSLPVMQMGLSGYIELIYENPELFHKLMAVNREFCVSWSNAQLQAGATAICYFNPMASPTMIARDMYLQTGFQVDKHTLAQINGPTAFHLASGNALPIIDDLVALGTAAVGVSSLEDLTTIKEACRNKISIIGNMNGIEMRHWSRTETETIIKEIIAAAAEGGGFILSDQHGEIPWQVDEEILLAISETVHNWGQYPIG
jgi:uroporphyrinogen decarboxylase